MGEGYPSGSEIRRIQKMAAEKVTAEHEQLERDLEEKRLARQHRESSEHAGMNKGDLTRSARARR